MTTFDRIKELLDRAGHPMMFVANEENHTIKPKAYATIAEAIDAYLKEKQRDDNDLIERLTAVLENVLNERDAMLKELKTFSACGNCKHGGAKPDCKDNDFLCDDCYIESCPCKTCDIYEPDNNHWEWRGVPDEEG